MVFLNHTEPKWNETKLPKHQNFGNFGSFRSSSVKSDIALIDFCKIILLFSFFQPFNAIEFFQNKILVMLCKASNSLSNLFGFFLFYKICNMITWLQFIEECSNHPTFPLFSYAILWENLYHSWKNYDVRPKSLDDDHLQFFVLLHFYKIKLHVCYLTIFV